MPIQNPSYSVFSLCTWTTQPKWTCYRDQYYSIDHFAMMACGSGDYCINYTSLLSDESIRGSWDIRIKLIECYVTKYIKINEIRESVNQDGILKFM